MAGLIKREDIDAVRERADLREVVEQYVTLKGAGIGSWKGLCPFHDERSPSFHIRPGVGTFHCFGCGESGDVIAFLMGMDHTSFQETVEKLAGRLGIELRYEDGGKGPDKAEIGRRQRLLDAHKIADEFFQAALQSPEAQTAREMLTGRGFTREHAAQFSVGYAPKGWDNLLKHLRSKGFTDEELTETGMFSSGGRGIYDRFRGRLMWPIRNMTGNTVGFGGRHLYEDDKGPKYLNSPETAIYKKSQVLYGIEHAKRHVAKQRQLVVVEGYTDVMACHVAGVETAVATCGTAFGEGHIRIARRLISDEGGAGEVIFTFDGDAAGQQAALKAFKEDHMFLAKTFIAVGAEGMDPCDIRQHRGDEAVRELISSKTPLFEFAIRAKLREFDLNTIEGRVGALRATAPIVGAIKDPAMRPAYTRELAGWLGAEMDDVSRAVAYAQKHQPSPHLEAEKAAANNQGQSNQAQGSQRSGGPSHGEPDGQQPRRSAPGYPRPDTRDPAVLMERQALEVILQHPTHLTAEQWEEIFTVRFTAPAHQAIHDGVRIAAASASDPRNWVQAVRDEVPEPIKSFVSELAVTSLPTNSDEHLEKYCQSILNRLVELKITHQKANLLGRLQRMDAAHNPEEHQALNRELMELEHRRRALREAEWG
ncbi:DNA primase [Nesterenkonia sp. E16_7]|uniref:DNA primase n=1 Tax=unclassified Nesterenkonia TaxID=2629769 RepID=UPI001A91C17F|nr:MULTISPECIES: DNA primase [unclassified Nesterenkonia]MBO0594416.1 DNA primase [Nesterenkonia sp. E16_10]MBO0598305.1 DNA primase [Nesterenkonia sp. E16_7]